MSASQTIDDCWNRIGIRGDHSCERLRELIHCKNCPVHADAAQRIMQRPLPQEYQKISAAQFSQPLQNLAASDASVLVFRIGREWLALPTGLAVRIAEKMPVHALPHRSNASLLGIINVNGALYPAISLANIVGVDQHAPYTVAGRHATARTLVVLLGQQACAMPVDEVHGIERFAKASLRPLPATVNQGTQRFMSGILDVGDRAIACLEPELLAYNVARIMR